MDEENINNENLNNGLEKMFEKLKQFFANKNIDEIPGVTPEQAEELKTLFSNFNEMKDNLKIEIHNFDPFTKSIITSIMSQLGGLDFKFDIQQPDDALQKIEAEVAAMPNDIERRSNLLDEIDRQLSRPDLSDSEMNELLDKRMKILDGLE